VGLVSRIKPGRGHELFLEAMAQALSAAPEVRGLIVGDGDERDVREVRARAAALGIQDRVALFNPGIRYDDALAAVDIGCLLHPGSSGTGQAALELMSMARPMAMLDHGVLGLLRTATVIPVETAASGGPSRETLVGALGSAFVSLVQDPDARLAQGEANRTLMERCFSRTVLQRQLTDLVTRLQAV